MAGFIYYDARADDARLTLALARTAALDHGAVVANYTEVTRLLHDAAGTVTGAHVRRVAPGDDAGSETEFDIEAAVVVNATGVGGPDDVLGHWTRGAIRTSIRPAKGIHVTVSRARSCPADIAAVIPVPEGTGDRSSWCPGPTVTTSIWGRPTRPGTALSTIRPACPRMSTTSSAAANAITTGHLTRDDVTGVWAGLRPSPGPCAAAGT